MAHLTEAGDVALDGHVVGRVGEDQLRFGAVEQPTEGLGIAGIAAQKAVLSEQPEIAGLRDRSCRRLRNCVHRINAICDVDR